MSLNQSGAIQRLEKIDFVDHIVTNCQVFMSSLLSLSSACLCCTSELSFYLYLSSHISLSLSLSSSYSHSHSHYSSSTFFSTSTLCIRSLKLGQLLGVMTNRQIDSQTDSALFSVLSLEKTKNSRNWPTVVYLAASSLNLLLRLLFVV